MKSCKVNTATKEEILNHFHNCDEFYLQEINSRISLNDYVLKIRQFATTFELWENNILVGLIAAYTNRGTLQPVYITNVSIIEKQKQQGLSNILMEFFIDYIIKNGFVEIRLEVKKKNLIAQNLYSKFGFEFVKDNANDSEIWKRV